jgi:spore germination protein YaaH
VREEDTAEESEATPTEPAPTPEPAAEAAPAGPAVPLAEEGEHELYTVQPGDNVYRLAIKCGMTQEAFMKLNSIPAPNALKLGSKVKLPKKPE